MLSNPRQKTLSFFTMWCVIFCIFAPQTHAVGHVVSGRVCRHIIRRLLTLCGGLFGTSQLSKNQTAQSSSECPLDVYNYCTYHTGNLHIRRGLQVACYGLVKALRRPQRERDEPIRTPRFFVIASSLGVTGEKMNRSAKWDITWQSLEWAKTIISKLFGLWHLLRLQLSVAGPLPNLYIYYCHLGQKHYAGL